MAPLSALTETGGQARPPAEESELPIGPRPIVASSLRAETLAVVDTVHVMASDGVDLYMGATAGRVHRMSLVPPHVVELLDQDTMQYVGGIALDQTHVYWAIPSGGVVKRAPKVGGAAELLSKEWYPTNIVVDEANVYWACPGAPPVASGVFRMTKLEGVPTRTAIAGGGSRFNVWRFGDDIIVREERTLRRLSASGASFVTDALGEGTYCSVALSGQHVAFTCRHATEYWPAQISSVPITGGPVRVAAIGVGPVAWIWPIAGGLLYATNEGASSPETMGPVGQVARLVVHRWNDTVDIEVGRWEYGTGAPSPNWNSLVVDGQSVYYSEALIGVGRSGIIRKLTLP